MVLQAATGLDRYPKLYHVDHLPDYFIAEGTDGTLYRVPTEAGGWMHRDIYDGSRDTLKRVSPDQARSSLWFVYGDIGEVTVAEG
jgi:hypothetical protein